MHVCSECGQTIPEDSDFCYNCGALKSKAIETDGQGNVTSLVCPSCGSSVGADQNYCRKCGSPLMTPRPNMMPVRLKKNAFLALMLALVPGFFNIYGLGHLVLKQWLRGAMFLTMSAIMFYIEPAFENKMLFLLLDVGVFMFQMLDVMKYMYEGDN